LDDLSIEGIELSFAMNFVLVEFACVWLSVGQF
jgi:hypothetical protein